MEPRQNGPSTDTVTSMGEAARSTDHIAVGNVVVPLEQAQAWVRNYTNPANISAKNPYAYPAYDTYEQDRDDAGSLSDADLLAPALLNVPIKIRSYYELQRIRPQLEVALSNINPELALVDIDDPERVAAMVKPLYVVLDDPYKPWRVNATTLSKVLHRKRPHTLVLHDRWVRACYVGPTGPVPLAEDRSWADYMAAITVAIGNDIRTQKAAFKSLDDAAGSPGVLSHVRLLDIVAWTSRGKSAGEEST